MCGIAGIIQPYSPETDTQNQLQQYLQQMNQALAHRGPDAESSVLLPEAPSLIGLAHRRLSILDLSERGTQPMHCLDRYHIVHNGEIYNYLEIRRKLKHEGYHFRSETDTEVIALAYDFWGSACLHEFDGMFAFAIWDSHRHQLFCARDRFGEKPLYYAWDPGRHRFLFASEMKALWTAGIERKTDPVLLYQYLCTGKSWHSTQPETTYYQGIRQLPARHALLFDALTREWDCWPYWDLYKGSGRNEDQQTILEQANELLQDSVRLRLRSDVPVGSSASGGIDSSAIVSIVHALGAFKNPSGFRLFHASFPGFDKDESSQAGSLAEFFRLPLLTVTPTAKQLLEDIDRICHHQEIPFSSSSVFAQYSVYRLARSHGVPVLLDGQGADETLAGYGKYLHWYLQELVSRKEMKQVKHEVHEIRDHGLALEWDARNYLAAFFPTQATRELERRSLAEMKDHPGIHPDFKDAFGTRVQWKKPVVEELNDILYFDTMQGELEELLRFADRNSMAHGVEVRLPFLSHAWVEFIFSLPSSYKIRDGWSKWILRNIMDGRLPESINWRRDKTGFEPPQQQWMKDPQVMEQVRHGKQILIEEGVLRKEVLDEPIQPSPAYARNSYDWRYWIAGKLF